MASWEPQTQRLVLFDMQGKLHEWRQERYVSYSGRFGSTSVEIEDKKALDDTSTRGLRGSSFDGRPYLVRSAYRNGYLPTNRYNLNGFRPSRTYHLSP